MIAFSRPTALHKIETYVKQGHELNRMRQFWPNGEYAAQLAKVGYTTKEARRRIIAAAQFATSAGELDLEKLEAAVCKANLTQTPKLVTHRLTIQALLRLAGGEA